MPTFDVSALAADLAEDHIAGEIDPLMYEELVNVLAPRSDTGIVLVAADPANPAALRDLAQDLQALSGLDIVIARSPGAVSIVSDSASRATIEAAEYDFVTQPEYSVALTQLWGELATNECPWSLIVVVALCVMAAAILLAWSSIKH